MLLSITFIGPELVKLERSQFGHRLRCSESPSMNWGAMCGGPYSLERKSLAAIVEVVFLRMRSARIPLQKLVFANPVKFGEAF